MTIEYSRGYRQGVFDQAVRQEARRIKKRMTFKRRLIAIGAGRIPLPPPPYYSGKPPRKLELIHQQRESAQ